MSVAETLSLAELEKLIDERQSQIEALLRKRDQLEQNIEKLDLEIQDFLSNGGGRRGSRKRPKNEAPLRKVIQDILSKNKKGLSLKALAQQVKDTGYKSHSQNFQNVVYQSLYNSTHIVHDDSTGLYRLTK